MVIHVSRPSFVFSSRGGRSSTQHIFVNELLNPLSEHGVIGEGWRSDSRYLSRYKGGVGEESSYRYLRSLDLHDKSLFETSDDRLGRPVAIH